MAWAFLAQASTSNEAIDKQLDDPKTYLKNLAGTDYEILYRIAYCESGWKETAKNPNSSASGLFQFINSTWKRYGQGDVFDPYNNINAAIDLYRAEGTRPWDESRNCWKSVVH